MIVEISDFSLCVLPSVNLILRLDLATSWLKTGAEINLNVFLGCVVGTQAIGLQDFGFAVCCLLQRHLEYAQEAKNFHDHSGNYYFSLFKFSQLIIR